jgi:hypothetical protein
VSNVHNQKYQPEKKLIFKIFVKKHRFNIKLEKPSKFTKLNWDNFSLKLALYTLG